MTFADCPDGSEDLECGRCYASIEVQYQTHVEITNVVFNDIPSTILKPPYDVLSRKALEKKDGSAKKSVCPICRQTVSPEAIEFPDLPGGSEELSCLNCNADLDVDYRASIEVTKAQVTEAPDAGYECPECGCSLELHGSEIESEAGNVEADCGECGASLEVSWSDWGEDAEATLLRESETSPSAGPKKGSRHKGSEASTPSCPRCDADLSIPNESDLVECENCGASVEITISSTGKLTDVELKDVPNLTVTCPECNDDLTIDGDEIEEEGGSIEVTCGCKAQLEVSWTCWGDDYDVDVLEEGDEEEEEDDDDDDDNRHRSNVP